MPLFVLVCTDRPNSLPIRLATREAHLAHIGSFPGQIKLAGPLLDDGGDMAGSLIIVDMADKAAVEAFSTGDPYRKAGLWERVDIKGFKAGIVDL